MTGRARIVVLDPVHTDAIASLEKDHDVVVRLQPSHDDLLEVSSEADALVVRSGVRITADVVAHPRQLKVGAGRDPVRTTSISTHAARPAFRY